MKTSTEDKRNGIQWTLMEQLIDLDFADDLALLSHTHQQMQEKTKHWHSVHCALDSTSIEAKVRSSVSVQATIANTAKRPGAGWCWQLHIPWQYSRQAGWNWCRRKGENWQGYDSIPPTENIRGSTYLTLNTKIRIFNTTVKPCLSYHRK